MDQSNLSEQGEIQSEIQGEDLAEFKTQVKQWLQIDEEISKYQKKINITKTM